MVNVVALEDRKRKKNSDQCQCPEDEELSEDRCIPKCTGGRTKRPDDNDYLTCQCPENQMIEKDENGKDQCVCPGRFNT